MTKLCTQKLLLLACLVMLFGGLRLTSTTTTTTFVAAMSIANQDLERYFRSANASQTLANMAEERVAIDMYTYAFINYTYYNPQPQEVQFDEEKARYGEGKVMNVKGKVVHITDAEDLLDDTACSADIFGTRGQPTPAAGVSWVALVRRGGCTFEDKVQHVYNKGAVGVIIYNDKPMNNLEKMQIKGKTRNITAVITYLEIGIDMARWVDQGFDMNVAIIEGRSGVRPINSLNRTSVLFVSISFIVLMVISLVWLIFYYIQRFRYMQNKDQQSRHLCSVTKKAIMKIPTRTGKSTDDKDADSDCCAICIETYKASDCIRVLPCKHEFHKNCIDPWLIEHRTCPMCKLDVLKFYGFVFIGSEESILEYDTDRSANAAAALAGASSSNSNSNPAAVGPQTLQVAGPGGGGRGALADLIRSRDFVVDFPRIFVLDTGGAVGSRENLFPARMPERSQSALSLANGAKDLMTAMSNKLEEQHGLRRLRKSQPDDGMTKSLLGVVSTDSTKRRRSHSADGRYTSAYLSRQEIMRQQQLTAHDGPESPGDGAAKRTKSESAALRGLTEASYAQSKQRQLEQGWEGGPCGSKQCRAPVKRQASEISLHELPAMPNNISITVPEGAGAHASWPAATDVVIRIEVNGENLQLN